MTYLCSLSIFLVDAIFTLAFHSCSQRFLVVSGNKSASFPGEKLHDLEVVTFRWYHFLVHIFRKCLTDGLHSGPWRVYPTLYLLYM